MKVYGRKKKSSKAIKLSEVSIDANLEELKTIINGLVKFEKQVEKYLNADSQDDYVGHFHYRDYSSLWSAGESDFIVCVSQKNT